MSKCDMLVDRVRCTNEATWRMVGWGTVICDSCAGQVIRRTTVSHPSSDGRMREFPEGRGPGTDDWEMIRFGDLTAVPLPSLPVTELLARIEAQAVRIAELESQLRDAQERLRSLPDEIKDNLISQMRRTAVNCGSSSSCAIAHWCKKSTEK